MGILNKIKGLLGMTISSPNNDSVERGNNDVKVLFVGSCGTTDIEARVVVARKIAETNGCYVHVGKTTSVEMCEPTITNHRLLSELHERTIIINSISHDYDFIPDERFESRVGWHCKRTEPLRGGCVKEKSKHRARSCLMFNNKQSKQRK